MRVLGLIIALGLGWTGICGAQETKGNAPAEEPTFLSGPIRITADRLTTVRAEKWAEFSGRVKAVQGSTVIDAQRIRVWYGETERGSGQPVSFQQAVEKIVADGEVRITMKDMIAEADQAVFHSRDGKLVLTGERALLRSQGNVVTGSTITFMQDEGTVIVEGQGSSRVEALFYPPSGSEDAGSP